MSPASALRPLGWFVTCLLASALGCAPARLPTPVAPYHVEDVALTTLQRDLATGQVTSAELVERYVARVTELDRGPTGLHSVIAINGDAAAIAHTLDAERAAGRRRGPLHGIPIALKDNIETGEPTLPTTAGSLALETHVTRRDAPLVARLRDAGAIVIAKTNLSEWANFRSTRSTSGWSAIGGLTRNAYAPDRNACGSSSGSGVAVSASFAAAAIGTETDGSITCPASVNGLVGLKPTVGLVSRRYIVPISAAQDTAGPMARTVADAAVLLTAMAGTDPGDSATRDANAHKTDYLSSLATDALAGTRLGVLRFLMGYDASVDALFEEQLAVLRTAGATIVDVAAFEGLDRIDRAEMTVLLTDFRIELNAYLASTPGDTAARDLAGLMAFNRLHGDREMPHFGQELFERAEMTAGHDVVRYGQLRSAVRRAAGADGIDALLTTHRVDALIAPTTGPAWVTDLAKGDAVVGSASTLPAVAGYPHLTVPMGFIDGLPVGLSFIGPAWSEARLLSMGYAFEQRTHARRPPILAFSPLAAAVMGPQ
ncbi:MAG: amidase [Vicinamibacterales bacterium]